MLSEIPKTGTVDDEDAPDDEHEGENEAPVREVHDDDDGEREDP